MRVYSRRAAIYVKMYTDKCKQHLPKRASKRKGRRLRRRLNLASQQKKNKVSAT